MNRRRKNRQWKGKLVKNNTGTLCLIVGMHRMTLRDMLRRGEGTYVITRCDTVIPVISYFDAKTRGRPTCSLCRWANLTIEDERGLVHRTRDETAWMSYGELFVGTLCASEISTLKLTETPDKRISCLACMASE
jgi:hypothetical protein